MSRWAGTQLCVVLGGLMKVVYSTSHWAGFMNIVCKPTRLEGMDLRSSFLWSTREVRPRLSF